MNLKVELTNKLKIGTLQVQLRQSDDVLGPLSNDIILHVMRYGHDICRRRGEQDFS